MLFSNIEVLMPDFTVKKHMYVGVTGTTINYVGDKKPETDYGEVIQGKHRLLMPAFYNAHTHSAMTLLRSMGSGMPLDRWLNESIFPYEATLTADDIYYGDMLAFAEMIRCGTVSCTDMYFFGASTVKAVSESGIKANISLPVTCFDPSLKYEDLPMYREQMMLFSAYKGAFGGRVKIDYCVHGEYTTTEKVVRGLAATALATGGRIHIHLSETKKEHDGCVAKRGMTPTAYFENCGLFRSPVTAAHCVWLTDADISILAENRASAAVNPCSNMKLGSGFAPVRKMLDYGVNVCLGTDGVASNNNLNIWKDMYLLSIIYNGYTGDASSMTAADALRCATVNGALSQGRTDCGLIKEGYRADLCVINTDVPNMYPARDRASELVYSANGADVVMTVCDGKVLYENGEYKTIDLERVLSYDRIHFCK
ncbi:MAG: amidohydrolase [Clostridia bacterium]|nr:amidohydrolase [Clostridia bacterium]MBQ9880783.1 amidohydrolase [Clostridia bacterium]